MKITRTILFGLAVAIAGTACGDDDGGPAGPDAGDGGDVGDAPDGSAGQARNPAAYVPGETYEPDVTADQLSENITNELFPAPVGATWVFEATSEDGVERIEIEVLSETKDVWGTTARVIRDTAFLDGAMIEDTLDWFSEDEAGNVWYMGEETAEYDPDTGEVVSTEGSWESGVDGALPGVAMLADPEVGDEYRQEFYADHAEDLGEIVSLSESVTVAAGTFDNCLKTKDTSAIEAALQEFKYYCPGVGTALVEEGDAREELIESSLVE